MAKNTFYITTPLYYVNASPHIGHSYTEVACDCLARYHRMKGEDVLFLTGTDEHGQKVQRSAQARGEDTIKFIDSIVPVFKKLWERLQISYDDFIRTTEARHTDTVKKVLSELYERGDIYQDEYRGFYCTPCETFWPKSQAENNLCPDCSRTLEEITEANYFFKISRYQGWLKGYIKGHPDFIRPDFRKNEVMGFLDEPLSDLCISRPRRRLSWGIEIPFASEHVTYVWFDALINYISACGWLDNSDRFKKYWPADLHLIGKDILRHHAVYWPIMLHALGIEPPKTIFAHGWWMLGGEKMSKSRGNIMNPLDIIDRYGASAYRYFILREVNFGLDGVFSEEAFIRRYNSDLANDLGNLLNRTLAMVDKYFSSVVPGQGDMSGKDRAIDGKLKDILPRLDKSMSGLNFSQAFILVWELINCANKHIEVSEPWQLAKHNRKRRLEAVIHILLKVLCYCAFLIYPFMPKASMKIAEQLGMGIADKDMIFANLKDDILKPGSRVKKGEPIFPRIEKEA